ncbi:MAG: ABC transporter ATP-binding protein [Acidobacteriia bacterium]|nr:ABC transporter ATP-binding protein [Terriglobia bacterium]
MSARTSGTSRSVASSTVKPVGFVDRGIASLLAGGRPANSITRGRGPRPGSSGAVTLLLRGGGLDGAALEFRNVTKRYEGDGGAVLLALRGASFAVPPGRKVAITGRSGSGKSTLLHLAAGIDTPTTGAVLVAGRDLGRMSEARRTLARRDGIGLVFQFFHLLPHLTVRDNVLLPAWIAGDAPRDAARRAEDLLARVDLGSRAGDAVRKLSGGEMQRVALCRALLRRPRLLLADEPTGNLDDDNSRKVMDLLLRLAEEEDSTLIYVTHSRELAALADETWRIGSGVLEVP